MLVAIVGPTASGKSKLAVELAQRFNGEVISADSRQVYRGLDIGSGKVTKREMRGVPHHLLDIASPRRTFTVAQFQRAATKIIKATWRRGKIPILCGGTGFYVSAVTQGLALPQAKPNPKLRKLLERKTTLELVRLLKHLDQARAKTIDVSNRRRLVRAIEVAMNLGTVPRVHTNPLTTSVLTLGLNPGPTKLRQLIARRLKARLRQGLVAEVRRLHCQGLSWKRLESFGLEYRYVSLFLQGKLNKPEFEQQLTTKIWQFAKRQMTWFKKMPNVQWVTNGTRAQRLVKTFVQMKKP